MANAPATNLSPRLAGFLMVCVCDARFRGLAPRRRSFFWKNQELLAPKKYGARDCFVLKSTSGPQDRTYFYSVTSWIDRGILFPVHVVKTLRGTGQQKEFIYYGLRQVGGAWSATQVEASLKGKPGSSILAIEFGSGKANLGRKDFAIGQFRAQGEKVK